MPAIGGAGYIGTHAVLLLIDGGWPIIVLDDLSPGFECAIPIDTAFIEGNIAHDMLLQQAIIKYAIGDFILFLHLNHSFSFRKVVPCKFFEYSAAGEPIIAGVEGYAAEFLNRDIPDAAMFEILDADALVSAVHSFAQPSLETNRDTFIMHYDLGEIIRTLGPDIVAMMCVGLPQKDEELTPILPTDEQR